MKIQLTPKIEGNILHLLVTYLNDGDAAKTLYFRAPNDQIAPGHVLIRASSGKQLLQPLEFTLVNPNTPGSDLTLAAHGGSHSILVKCILDGRLLRLPNESYLLVSDMTYEIQVTHGAVFSNHITLSLADFVSTL
jgi:hypothetical protein